MPYEVEKPKKFAVDMDKETLAAMSPVDKLCQYVMPRMIDKVNMLAWTVEKNRYEFDEILTAMRKAIGERDGLEADRLKALSEVSAEVAHLRDGLEAVKNVLAARGMPDVAAVSEQDAGEDKNAAEPEVKVKRRSRAKKAAQPVPDVYVSESEYAVYDPDKDEWQPREVDGHKITGALIDTVEHLSGAAGEMFSDTVINYVGTLPQHVRQAIRERFPN